MVTRTVARVVSGTAPYPWPYDGGLHPSRLALVVTGQPWDDQPVQARLDRLAAVVAGAGGLVVAVRHRPPNGSPGVWSGATDAVEAAGLDGFYGSRLDADLRAAGRDQLLVAGWGLETAVHSTLRSANDRGYECLLVADACAAVDPDCRAGAISTVLMSGGIFGAVGDTGAVCAALERFLSQEDRPQEDRPEEDRP